MTAATHADFLAFLKRHSACKDAYDWAAAQTALEDCWLKNERSDWMLWLLFLTPQTDEMERNLHLTACDFAEAVLPLFENERPDDTRPRAAIETARRFVHVKATEEEMTAARDAAWAAAGDAAWAAAGDAAWAAAWAAAGDAAGAAWAARAAAGDAAGDAAGAAEAAAGAAARRSQAEIIRRYFPTMPEFAR